MTSVLENQVAHHDSEPFDDDNTDNCLEAYRWRNHATQFPWKLHMMLEDAEMNNFSNIVAWLPDQRTFRVHDNRSFVEQILPQYFRQTQYKSFQRQLNLWGFERINQNGINFGGYRHEHFVRGHASLCQKMKRLKIKGNGPKRTLSPTTSPSKKEHHGDSFPQIVSPTSPPVGAAATASYYRGMRDVAMVSETKDGGGTGMLTPPLPSKRTTPFQKQRSSERFVDLFDEVTLASVLLPGEEPEHFAVGTVNHHSDSRDKMVSLHRNSNDKVTTLESCSLLSKKSPSRFPVVVPYVHASTSFPPPSLTQSWDDEPHGLQNIEEFNNLDEEYSLQPGRDVLSISPFPFFS